MLEIIHVVRELAGTSVRENTVIKKKTVNYKGVRFFFPPTSISGF